LNLAQVSNVKINNLTQDNLAVIDNQTISFVLKEDTVSGAIKVTTSGGIATSSNNLIVLETDLLIKNKTYNFVPGTNVISSFLSTFNNKILSNVTLNLASGTYLEDYLPLLAFRTIGQGLIIQGQGINNTTIKGRIDCINLKTVSSRLMRKEYGEHLKRFYWSEKPMFWGGSYALITVGTQAPLEKLIQYVQNQEKPE
jgi:hypothetical protein